MPRPAIKATAARRSAPPKLGVERARQRPGLFVLRDPGTKWILESYLASMMPVFLKFILF